MSKHIPFYEALKNPNVYSHDKLKLTHHHWLQVVCVDAVHFVMPDIGDLDKLCDFGAELFIEKVFRLPFDSVRYSFTKGTRKTDVFASFSDRSNQLVCCVVDTRNTNETTVELPLLVATLRKEDKKLQSRFAWLPKLNDVSEDNQRIMSQAAITCVLAYTVLLMSKNTHQRIEPAPTKLNKRRAMHGRAPIPERRYVTINTNQHPINTTKRGGTHASPVMHWRRGHFRQLPDKVVSVAPSLVNAIEDAKPLAKEYKIK